MTGKTALFRSLREPERQWGLNTVANVEPDLRRYNIVKHGLLILDETRPSQVVEQKRLFQAGTVEVGLLCCHTT